jgi:hypothetical protein
MKNSAAVSALYPANRGHSDVLRHPCTQEMLKQKQGDQGHWCDPAASAVHLFRFASKSPPSTAFASGADMLY